MEEFKNWLTANVNESKYVIYDDNNTLCNNIKTYRKFKEWEYLFNQCIYVKSTSYRDSLYNNIFTQYYCDYCSKALLSSIYEKYMVSSILSYHSSLINYHNLKFSLFHEIKTNDITVCEAIEKIKTSINTLEKYFNDVHFKENYLLEKIKIIQKAWRNYALKKYYKDLVVKVYIKLDKLNNYDTFYDGLPQCMEENTNLYTNVNKTMICYHCKRKVAPTYNQCWFCDL